jgi:hypothetical protein
VSGVRREGDNHQSGERDAAGKGSFQARRAIGPPWAEIETKGHYSSSSTGESVLPRFQSE